MAIVPYDYDYGAPLPVAPDNGPQVETPVDQPSAGEVMSAAVRQDNTIGSYIADRRENPLMQDLNEKFDTWGAIKGTKYEEHWDKFADVFTRRAYLAMKAQIDQEAQDRRTLASAGWAGHLASFGAAIADWPTFLPAGNVYRSVKVGEGVLKTMRSMSAFSVVASTASEAALHSTQVLRTPEESAFAIGGSAILGGLGGALLGRATSAAERRALAARIDAELRVRGPDELAAAEGEIQKIMDGLAARDSSVGAASVRADTLDDLTVAGRAASAVNRWSSAARLNPIVRLLESPSAVVRRVATGLFEAPLYLKKNLAGEASEQGVETLVKTYHGATSKAVAGTDQLFRDYRTTGGTLRRDQFRQEVGRTMRRGDEHPVPQVAAAAKLWRETVFEPLKNEAIRLGMLPKDVDVKTADSYFSRLWNWRRIEANEGQFRALVTDWTRKTVKAEVKRLTAHRDARLASIRQEMEDLQLSGADRAALLSKLSDDLKAHTASGWQFEPVEDQLSLLRSLAHQAAKAGDEARVQALRGSVRKIVADAGSEYADYVAARNLLATRIRNIRNSVAGRQEQVERLRGRIADIEIMNIGRLRRLHGSLSSLDEKIARNGVDRWAEELAQARTEFGLILERSNRALDRLAGGRERLTREGQQAAAEGNAARAVEIDEELRRGDPFVDEAKRQEAMSELAARIGDLEAVDPEAAVRELGALVEQRLAQSADIIGRESVRMEELARRADALDPEHGKKRVAALADRMKEIERAYNDRVSIGLDADNNYEGYVGEIVDSIYNSLTGRLGTAAPRDIVPVARGPLKERTFNIPDTYSAPGLGSIEDFLEHDVELVGRRYARVMAGDVELTRKFGSADLKDTLKEVERDYQARRAALTKAEPDAAKREKALRQLNARERRDVSDVEALRDMLRGVYLAKENASTFARVSAVANTINYLRSLGGVVMSSLADVARPMMIHGLLPYMRDGVAPLLTNLKAVKMSVADAREAGAVAERILNNRMATWAEITDPYSHNSPFERFVANTAQRFSQANGMIYWNDFMKSFASTMSQNRILRGVIGLDTLNAKERAYLAMLGIDDTMAKRIASQYGQYGHSEGQIRIASLDKWTDLDAKRAYSAALIKDVDSIIVTKGIGDTPLFARTPVGRMVLQFKGFALASHQRAFMRGLQAAELGTDSRSGVIAGMLTSVAIGMLIYALKAIEIGRSETFDNPNPGHWVAEGLDRSGLFAVAFEINNTIEKGLNLGAYRTLEAMFPNARKGQGASRYRIRSTAAAFTGPTGDLVDSLVRVVAGAQDWHLKGSDVDAIAKLVPGTTLPGIRSLLEYGVMPAIREAIVQ